MDDEYLNQMRDYLTVIHDEFAILYDVAGQEDFAMDIEYKVTAQNQLAIKQARPWVSFWADINGDYDLAVDAIINPETSSTQPQRDRPPAHLRCSRLKGDRCG